jgi:hypothetical protein
MNKPYKDLMIRIYTGMTAMDALSIPTQLHQLNDKWDMYYHLPHNKDWALASYSIIQKSIHNMETVVGINSNFHDAVIKNCMLFVMKSGITPMWEDPKNREGGCFSYKVSNKFVIEVWKTMFCLLAGNSLSAKKECNKYINGITISPKKNFCIIKIWLSVSKIQDPTIIENIPNLSCQGCLFKKHEPEF